MQFSEAFMEKRQSRSVARTTPPVGEPGYTSPIKFVQPASKPAKLSREDISRCINIWAHLYRQCDAASRPEDMYLPSRPWIGRDPNSVKRFE